MAELSIPDTHEQPLLATFLAGLEGLRTACQQERPFQRLGALALGASVNYGRQTITQQLATLGVSADWSAFYRLFNVPRLDYEALSHQLCETALPLVAETEPCVAAIDGTQIPRHSRTMPGTSYLYNPASPLGARWA